LTTIWPENLNVDCCPPVSRDRQTIGICGALNQLFILSVDSACSRDGLPGAEGDRKDPSSREEAANSVRIKAGCAAEQPALFYAKIVLNLHRGDAMKTMMARYSRTLAKIKEVPYSNRQRAIKRFILLMDFKERFAKVKLKITRKLTLTHFLTEYCKMRKIPEDTFWKWWSAYQKNGIQGLVPKYRITSESTYPMRDQKLIATILIDPEAPLACLTTINQIIQRCRLIKPEVRSFAATTLARFSRTDGNVKLSFSPPLSDEEILVLKKYKRSTHKNHSRRATGILMINDGRCLLDIEQSTNSPSSTIYKWLRRFKDKRLESIETHSHCPQREERQAERQRRILDIVHKMPAAFGINRTTWTYGAIIQAYMIEYGCEIGSGMIKAAVQKSGYKWQRARRVLMSPDPHYREKVQHLLDVLQSLKDGEHFFFIDEAGPYRVKKYGGKVLRPDGKPDHIETPSKSRGKIQFAAALEAVTNQMTWVFGNDKSSATMLQLLNAIAENNRHCGKLYLTWDAITMHYSHAVTKWVNDHNQAEQGPKIEVVPLPVSAQFLNVIEAVFSGMKRAVICNSDYASVNEMQQAIALHFEERNAFYRANPKRAGNKIWDKQAFDLDKLAGGLFRRM